MKLKKLKVVLKTGSTYKTLFDSVSEAVKKVGAPNIGKIVEVNVDDNDKYGNKSNKEEVLVISRRTNDDLDKSLAVGYTVSYNKPNLDKAFEGMKVFEISPDRVLIGTFVGVRSWDPNIHKDFIPPGYKPDEDWQWAIYNRNSIIMDRKELEDQIGRIPGTQGGIGYYIPKKKNYKISSLQV